MSADSQQPDGTQDEAHRLAELTAIIEAVKDRVRARYPSANGAESTESSHANPIRIRPADLMPIVHARDAAQAKMGSIGTVNPRPGGTLNRVIQVVKKTIARSLRWFVRDQVTFNRQTMQCIETIIESLNEVNRGLMDLAGQTSSRLQGATDLRSEAEEIRDALSHWNSWRSEWERKLLSTEALSLRAIADLQGAFQHRVNLLESNFRQNVAAQHREFTTQLESSTLNLQRKLWDDFERFRLDHERLIHAELRLIRQRATGPGVPQAAVANQQSELATAAQPSTSNDVLPFDYARFAERFRGSEDYVRQGQKFYLPYFEGRRAVIDVGCGRGEFLELMRDHGIPARGVDSSSESVEACRAKGLNAETADLFSFLRTTERGSVDAIFCSQVVEHLPPHLLPEMIRLCSEALERGGLLAIETPNPECLAIFATHFYLDPTHVRPVPRQLAAFYMEEFGFGGIRSHNLAPAVESFAELKELPEGFRERFFGGLDYAIIARKL